MLPAGGSGGVKLADDDVEPQAVSKDNEANRATTTRATPLLIT